jgi:predicted alpha/beta-fold hydrolase
VYSPPWFLFNPHLETIYPSLFRKVELKGYLRKRINTPDNDFLDLDWLAQGKRKIVIISHGLEGNSQRAYMKGMAKAFHANDFDVLTWNYRGCSEEMNNTLRFYHSGATEDLSCVVDHVIAKGYENIFLIGFSLGGNLTLKYAGERRLDARIKGVATFSVPMNLHTSCIQISKRSNWIYSQRFVRSLRKKIKAKAELMPELDIEGLDSIDNLLDFDDRYTAPLHGFKNAIDYYRQCGAIRFIEDIKVPTLVVNAKNDPFLSKECFPAMNNHPFVKLEFPDRGGHVGFASFNGNGLYWSEQRALDFITQLQ